MTTGTPAGLRTFLGEKGLRAKKSLSQNFLIDPNSTEKIVRLANVGPGDLVLEIGPGPGALTECLLQAGAKVLAIEMDRDFARELRRLGPEEKLHILERDALQINVPELLEAHLAPGQKARVVANLPYQITTPLLTKLLPMEDYISNITVMVQKEVADRMAASPGGRIYGSLSVFLNNYARVLDRFTVKPACFHPRPKVDSTVISMELHPSFSSDPDTLFLLSRRAFQQRRKTLRGTLKEFLNKDCLEKSLEEMGLSPSARPEELSVQNFECLAELVRGGRALAPKSQATT